jgi:hypothetical protein
MVRLFQVNDDDRRDLIERVHQMQEMEKTQGWTLLKDYVNRHFEIRYRELVNGNVTSHEEYKAKCAWLQGAQFVLSATKDLALSLERELIEDEALV